MAENYVEVDLQKFCIMTEMVTYTFYVGVLAYKCLNVRIYKRAAVDHPAQWKHIFKQNLNFPEFIHFYGIRFGTR